MGSLINQEMLATMRALAAGTPPGALVEVGVYKGGSAAVLNEVAQEQGRALYLFDTFDGMPFQGPLDLHRVGDFADTSAAAVLALCPGAIICEGIFPHTLGETGLVAFVHADADQYQSTLDVCERLGPRMVAGGLMLFDDYCLDGCRTAVDESYPERELLLDGRALVRF
jgi:O-methyltransferase